MNSSFASSLAIGAVFVIAPFVVLAESQPRMPSAEAERAQVIFLGEQHDNPAHHALQAEWVAVLEPRALVFEMLTAEQASAVTPENRHDEDTLASALAWETSGWPAFSMYFPIFNAAPAAGIFGAGVPRDKVKSVMNENLATIAGPEVTARFALDLPLPDAEQAAREELQRVAHCNALPDDLLPRMVSVQRLRDAALAQAALEALEMYGAPVIVITGNGHAREDWGAPYLLRQAAPEVAVFTLGQAEAGQTPGGGFSFVMDGPAVDRGDPCEAFN